MHKADAAPTRFTEDQFSEIDFSEDKKLLLAQPNPDWDVVLGHGPVVATAIHDGHAIRPSLRPHLAVTDDERRREEDPLTGLLTAVGDVRIRVDASRFQADLNRPREKAISTDPADTWGLRVWRGELPATERDQSLADYDAFYAMAGELIERLIERWGCVLLIDIHSYNHRRDGADAAPAPQQDNPDIELGVTTLDPDRWGEVALRFAQALRDTPVAGCHPDVRENVRFPTGGYFPEWVYATWGERVCTISPEYKKIYMDEWTGQVDIAALEGFRRGLHNAVDAVRGQFTACT
ncbi:N-formylglutamate amidohydrolase [Lysobacter sp. A378]